MKSQKREHVRKLVVDVYGMAEWGTRTGTLIEKNDWFLYLAEKSTQ
jgi:hypothetical protein